MKSAVLFTVLSAAMVFNIAYAGEHSENIAAYCKEQAELSGIEAASEKNQFIRECIDSFGVTVDDVQVDEPQSETTLQPAQ